MPIDDLSERLRHGANSLTNLTELIADGKPVTHSAILDQQAQKMREAADRLDAAEDAADLLPAARRYLDPDATPQDTLSRIVAVANRWQSVGAGGDDDD